MRKRRVYLVNEGVRAGGELESWNCHCIQHVSRKVRSGRELGCDAPPRAEKGLGVNLGGWMTRVGWKKRSLEAKLRNRKARMLDAEVTQGDHRESAVNEIAHMTGGRGECGVGGCDEPRKSVTLQEQRA